MRLADGIDLVLKGFAVRAFRHTASYDDAVFRYLETTGPEGDARLKDMSDQFWKENAYDEGEPDRVILCVGLKAVKDGPAKGLVSGLEKMLPEYYELRGWTADGVPTNETLSRLAL